MAIQVTSLMWMRTTMNYQFKNGGYFWPTLKKLWAEGGVVRFYRGIIPALIIGPMSRFGDTATNMMALTVLSQYKDIPIFVQTSMGSVLAGLWRLITLPVDAWKTSKQVYGGNGLQVVINKYKTNGISAFYQGAIASAVATMVGHYPWFVTNNYLEHYLKRYNYKEEPLKAVARSAFIGLCATVCSDVISNSIRVIKTSKQTSETHKTYNQVLSEILAKDGVKGLFFRGLETKLLTNVISGIIFSIAWKYIHHVIHKTKD